MTNSKHTPGPWQLHLPEYGQWVIIGNGYAMATLNGAVASDHTQANGRLIAAAPDLLAACEAALDPMEEMMEWAIGTHNVDNCEGCARCEAIGGARVQLAQLRAAIAKARGK